MKKKHYVGIRSKIVTYTIVCIVFVGLVSNLFLYQFMRGIIEDKVENIEDLYAKTITGQLDYALEQVSTLGFYCVNSTDVVSVLRHNTLDRLSARNDALTAQDVINTYLRTSPIDSYINKLFIFNNSGVIVHALSTYSGTNTDVLRLQESQQYQRWREGKLEPFDQVDVSLNPGGNDCFALFSEVYAPNVYTFPVGYVYLEVDTRIVTDILRPYEQVNRFFVQMAKGDRLSAGGGNFLQAVADSKDPEGFSYLDNRYAIRRYSMEIEGLSLASCINMTELLAGNQNMRFSIAMVVIMIIGIGTAILIILTRYITKPIGRIMDKINKIALNDYSFDPELERPNNEMGEVGARLNELGLGIQKLLDETIALHDERAEIEMALLQSQVNPHFLYNTLNSVHYMAVMQKNLGIEKIVKNLVNLLKNVSKGVSDKIPLSEELALLHDYVSIQSVRYIGAFDYVCNIPESLQSYPIIKFTLQPLVENAMLHGVVPKVTFGTITLDAYEEGEFLIITVTDDGIGMEREEVEQLLKERGQPDKASMSGIGVANVNRRLKLTYGQACGLRVESEKGVYTKVSVRIPKERK